jgi:hypothetical protein
MSVHGSDTYILFCHILSRWVGFQMSPAGLHASDSSTRPPIEPNHTGTKAGLFTTTALNHLTRHALFPVSWWGGWGQALQECLHWWPAAGIAAVVTVIAIIRGDAGMHRL